MRHIVNLYQGEYKIVDSEDGIRYLAYQNSGKPPIQYTFTSKAASKEFILDITKLDLTDEDAIKGFSEKNGLLINTQSDSDFPTYCGIPIAKDYAQKISPSPSGISMSLGLFRYTIELIRNILRLSTEISLYKEVPPKHFNSNFNKTLYEEEYSKSIIKLVQSFLSLLYQPYTMHETLYKNLNWVLGGSTPISRFTYYFHCILLYIGYMNPKYVYEDYISTFNHALQELCHKNLEIYQRLNSENHNLEQDDSLFQPIKELKLEILAVIICILDYKKLKELYPDTSEVSISPENLPLKVKVYPITSCPPDLPKKKYEINITEEFPDSEIEKLAYDSIHLGDLADLLVSMEKYFNVSYKDSQIYVTFKDTSDTSGLYAFMDKITEFGKQFILENINIYTSNINYRLSIEANGEYKLQLVSESLLQSLFLEMANILNNYNVTICKYPPCNNPVFSTKNKSAKCCCHNHYTNYKGLVDRESKKLFQR